MFRRKTYHVAMLMLTLVCVLGSDAVLGGGGGKKPPPEPIDAAMAYSKETPNGSSLWVATADGSQTFQVTDFKAGIKSFSPDGQKIVFLGQKKRQPMKLYIVNTDGTGLAELYQPNDQSYWWHDFVDWSPDGSKIAFKDQIADGSWDIFTINVDGTNLVNVTNTPGRYEMAAYWSPEGDRLIVTRDYSDQPNKQMYYCDLVILYLDPEGQVIYEEDITNFPGHKLEGRICITGGKWANTCDLIVADVMQYSGDGVNDLFLIDLADPFNPVNLTKTPIQRERMAYFTAMDDQIVFERTLPGGTAIWTMNPDGTNQSVFVSDPKAALVVPRWRRNP